MTKGAFYEELREEFARLPGIGLLGTRIYPLAIGLEKITIVTILTDHCYQFRKNHYHSHHHNSDLTELEDTPASVYTNVNLHFTFVPLIFFVFHPVVSEH